MRLDNIPATNIGQAVMPRGAGAQIRQLEAGDAVTAKVLSNENGKVTLKTTDGDVIRATLEEGVELPAGSEATLVVSEKTDGVIYMRLAPEMLEGGPQAAKPDPETAACVKQLAELNLPVSDRTVDDMRTILAQYPDMPLDQAAFLAANNMTELSPSLLDAAMALLSGDANTAVMLDSLAQLLTQAFDAAPREAGQPQAAADTADPARLLARALEQAAGGGEIVKAPQLTMREWMAAFLRGEAEQVREAPAQPEQAQSAARRPEQPVPETPPQAQDMSAEPQAARAPEQRPAVTEQGKPSEARGGAMSQTAADQIRSDGEQAQDAQTPAQDAQTPARSAQAPAADFSLSERGSVIRMLAQMPSFESMSDRALGQIAGFLEGLPQMETPGGDLKALGESLTKLIDELFVRPKGEAKDIQRAREELYVRLSYLREAISRSGMERGGALVERTERLMEHAKLMSDIEQFVYVQIPVKNGEDTTMAQLYVFRRESGGSRRIDPENARILLALDLTNMGHIESFIEIKGREVSLQLEVESEGVKAAFMRGTARLNTLIAEAGYKFSNSAVRLREKETTLETGLLSLLSFERRTMAGLDFTI